MRTYAVLNDIQIQFADKPVMNLVLDFLKDLQPYGIILNGDIVDCYQLSTFDKDPIKPSTLKGEIIEAGRLMDRFSLMCTAKWWIGGNHEARLKRILRKHAPEFDLLPEFQFEALFNLQRYGFNWKEYGDGVWLGKLWVTHGDLVRAHSAATAKIHFDNYGVSTMIGHTHRLGAYFKRNRNGVFVAYENGCLCRLHPEYATFPNWQQGFSIVHVDGGWFNVQQIPILNRSVFYYGKERIGRQRK